MSDAVRLHPDEHEAIALRTAQLVLDALQHDNDESHDHRRKGQPDTGFNATAADIARRHGVSARWVRENAAVLGGVRLGTGEKPPHRFNVAITDMRIGAMRSSSEARPSERAEPIRKGRRKVGRTDVPLLPIKGRKPT